MKNIWIKIIFVISFMTSSQSAFSQFLLEPYAGYGFSLSGEKKNTDTDLSYSGGLGGSRLGWAFSNVMVGFFGDRMYADLKLTNPGLSTTLSIYRTYGGLFLGVNLNSGLRFWGEYLGYVRNTYDMDGNIYDKGTGWGVAIGYLFNKKIALNLQYRNTTLDESQTGSLVNDIVSSELIITLSFPIYPFN